MKVYRSETGIQIKCTNTSDIQTLSELKEAIENACGVPIENQVLMTSLGIQVRDANLSQVVKSQGSDESIVLCYDTRCYNTEAEENIQAVLEEEIPVLERQILPIDGTSLSKQFKKSIKTLSPDDACKESLKLFNAIDHYSRSLIDTATTHYELSVRILNEHEIQQSALNVAMRNLETHSGPTQKRLFRYLRRAEQVLNKQRPILANVDRDLLILSKLKIHNSVRNVLIPDDHSKQYLIDFVDKQNIMQIKSATAQLCDRLSAGTSEMKSFFDQINTDASYLKERVQDSNNMYSLREIFAEIRVYMKRLKEKRSKMKRDLQRAYDKLSLISDTPISAQFNSLALDESRFGDSTTLSNEGSHMPSTASFAPLAKKDSKKPSLTKVFESFLQFATINIKESLPEMAQYEFAVRQRTEQLLNSKKKAIAVFISCMKIISNFQMMLHEANIDIDNHNKHMDDFHERHKGNDLQILPQIVFSYGAIMIEILRRREYANLLVTNSTLIGDVLGQYRASEEGRREYFRQRVVKEMPFKLAMSEIDKASPQSEISVNGNDSNAQLDIGVEDITQFISVVQHLYVDTPLIASGSRILGSPNSNSSSDQSDSSGSPRKTEKDKPLFIVLSTMKQELDNMKSQWMASVRNYLFDGNDLIRIEEMQGSVKAMKHEEIKQSMLDIDTVDIRSSKLTSPTSSIYQLIGNDKILLEENDKLKREVEQLKQDRELLQAEKNKSGEELAAARAELDVVKEEMDRIEQDGLDQTEEIAQLKDVIKTLESEKEDLESAKRSFLNEIKNKDKSADFRIASAEEDFNAKLSDLQYKLEEEKRMKKNLEIEHASELNSISIDHQKKMEQLNALLEEEKLVKRRLDGEISSLVSRHKAEVDQLNALAEHEKQNADEIKHQQVELQRRFDQLCENMDSVKEKLQSERAFHEEQLSNLHADMEAKDRAAQQIKELQEQTRSMVKQCQDDWYAKNEELKAIKEEQQAIDVAVRKLLKRFRPDDQDLQLMSLDGYVDLFRENLEGFQKEFGLNKDSLDAATQELADVTEGYTNLIDNHNEWRSIASRMADKLEEFRKNVIFEIVTQLQMPMDKNELIALTTMVTPSDDDAAIWNEVLKLSSGVNTQKFVFSVVKYVRDTYSQAKQFKREYRVIKDKYDTLLREYVEKIAFKSFREGDLALWLPTKNSTGKPWAAFNINAPHYFLKSTDNIAPQMQSREWIVARIVSITEYVTDGADPESNPFGLADGVTYRLVEVENYRNSKQHPNKRRHVSSNDSGLASIPNPRHIVDRAASSVHSYTTK
ncbi:hypothetical protein MBANPS3_008703 [Mucor bainieri]